jgi:hypothetical protein
VDQQRQINERASTATASFVKALEHLGSEKREIFLGGVYSMERISRDSDGDYWTVMETLAGLVRERSRRAEAERTSQDFEQRVSRRAYFLWQEAGRPDGLAEDFWARAVKLDELGEPPTTDIAAVLTVIKRRRWEREDTKAWHLDLSGAVLKLADLGSAHLEGANLRDAHLEGAMILGW